jgi:ribosomal protein L11 methyltransferase
MRTWPAIDVQRLSEPDLLQAALTDYDVVAIDERTGDSWRLFFQSAEARDQALDALRPDFPAFDFSAVDVPDEDWAARSQAALRAVRIGRLVIAPPWDLPPADTLRGIGTGRAALPAGQVVIIQPSMGFGTGHHPTTRLCLAALQQFNVNGSTVLDVGTGSGVLAIAAQRLGAARVIAIDDDPDAVQSARENGQRNGATVDFRVADLRTLVVSRFDLVLANLTGGLIRQSAGRLQDFATPRGPIILSGFTRDEEQAVVAAFPRLRMVDRAQEDEWVCITLQRESAFE